MSANRKDAVSSDAPLAMMEREGERLPETVEGLLVHPWWSVEKNHDADLRVFHQLERQIGTDRALELFIAASIEQATRTVVAELRRG